MDIKQRLQKWLADPQTAQWWMPAVVELCSDALAEIERLEKYKAEAVRLARWCNEYLPGDSAIVTADLICDVILDDVPDDYEPPEWK
jgi:hypothetical protein